MLLIEIILTIVAWRKGWRRWALVPGAVGLLMGFMVGAMMVATGTPLQANLLVSLFPVELICVMVPLIVLAIRAPKTMPASVELPANASVVKS